MSIKTDNNTENKSSKETGIFDKTKKAVSLLVKMIDKLAGMIGSIGKFIGKFIGALPSLGKILVVSALAGGMTLLVKAFASPLTIDKTENVVSEIKRISEFTTACFYEEKTLIESHYQIVETPVYKKAESDNKVMNLLGIQQKQLDSVVVDSVLAQIAYITHGKVRAGYNLSRINDDGLLIKGDTLTINLPDVEIFDIIVNPSDLEEFDRYGEWTEDEITVIVSKAKEEIKQDAIDFGIMEKAVSSGKEKMVSLFKTFGFNEVVFVE